MNEISRFSDIPHNTCSRENHPIALVFETIAIVFTMVYLLVLACWFRTFSGR